MGMLLVTAAAEAHELELRALKFYAVFAEAGDVINSENKVVSVKKGEQLEFHEYAPHSGIAPDILNVGVAVANTGNAVQRNVEIRLAVTPKVGRVILYQETPDLPVHEATEKTAEWLAPILLLKQTVNTLPPRRVVQVTFRNIKLGSILKEYSRRHLWPVMMSFEASIEPVDMEATINNNTKKRNLTIRMWE